MPEPRQTPLPCPTKKGSCRDDSNPHQSPGIQGTTEAPGLRQGPPTPQLPVHPRESSTYAMLLPHFSHVCSFWTPATELQTGL